MKQVQQQKIIGNYVILAESLGQGAFAICQKAYVENDPSQLSAVKIISKLKLKEETFIGQHIERIRQEIQTQKQLNSEYIVKILEVQQSSNNIYVFLEYCNGGNLQQFKKNKKGILAESEVIKIIGSLKSAFEEMYEKNCIHRDLKPENILLHDGQIKLADFGFAKIVEDMNKPEAQTQLGTPLYIPLEILEQQPYSSKCDVFSLGIIIFELLFGFHPFYNKETQEISFPALANILKSKKVEFPPEIAVHNKLLVDLISKMLQIDEKDRISWPQFFTHQFFTQQNEENIQQQVEINNTQDSLDKALLQTNKYLNTNLVQGDISLIKKNAKGSVLGATQLKELQSKYSQEELNKKVDEINHYMNYERNIAIFYSNIVQQCFTLNTSRVLKLQKEQFYKLLFLLSKFSLIFLNNVDKYLTGITEFKALKDQNIFKYYQTLPIFEQTSELIKNDQSNLMELFKNLLPKVEQITKNQNDMKFQNICNNNFNELNEFKGIFSSEISQILEYFWSNLDQFQSNRGILIVIRQLEIGRNPYTQFNFRSTDFHKFYESFQRISLSELIEDILKYQ